MAKQTTSFRVSEETSTRIDELMALFRESGGEVIERAVKYLYANRKEAAKQDLDERLKQANIPDDVRM